MDERWELKSGNDVLWVESDDDPARVTVFIHDDAGGAGICVTFDEACRIALELLWRSGMMTPAILRAIDDRLPIPADSADDSDG